MQLSSIFVRSGPETFDQLLRAISLGRLRTYQLFDPFKTRLHLHKLNTETLRKAAPRLLERLQGEDSAVLATELSQAILISHMDMIKAVLDHLGVPHEEGFFAKDSDTASFLKDGWQQKAWDQFHAAYPPAALLFYINHLDWEVLKAEEIFTPGVPLAKVTEKPAEVATDAVSSKKAERKAEQVGPQMSFDLG